jgi:hypothetical protein
LQVPSTNDHVQPKQFQSACAVLAEQQFVEQKKLFPTLEAKGFSRHCQPERERDADGELNSTAAQHPRADVDRNHSALIVPLDVSALTTRPQRKIEVFGILVNGVGQSKARRR